jgi:hypothetical protein
MHTLTLNSTYRSLAKVNVKQEVGYKDRQKKDAFVQMTHVGDALHLHEAAAQERRKNICGLSVMTVSWFSLSSP